MTDLGMLEMVRGGMSTAPQDIAREDAASFAVYRQLRVDITSCRLRPNDKLRFEDLRQRYSASVGTLREALSHLVSDGLVRIDVGRGFRVAPVSVEDLEDITSWRIEFENRAIKASIQNGDDNWEANIVSSYHLLSKITVPPVDAPVAEVFEYTEKHTRFHDALVACCGSPWLLFFRSALQAQAQRYQALSMVNRDQVVNRAVDEHRAIMDAAIARDIAGVTALVTDHIRKTAHDVLELLEQSGAMNNLSNSAEAQKSPRRRGRPRKAA